jgi:hypothetical protein
MAALHQCQFIVTVRVSQDRTTSASRLLTTLTYLGAAVDVTIAGLRLAAFLPADEAAASILTEIWAGE